MEPRRGTVQITRGFGAAVASGFKNYATFGGRARRSEYWWWMLFVAVGNAVMGGSGLGVWGFSLGPAQTSEGGLAAVFALLTFIPTLAVTWRRLHDTDRSGAWFFIQLVPVIGTIWLFVLAVQDGTWGVNRFGGSPKGR
jgi:uncharacterized membrane protein YhaH (DUF805 family)